MNTLEQTEQARLGLLRERFMEVALRRVPADVAEDLVQEALLVVVARGREAGFGPSAASAGAAGPAAALVTEEGQALPPLAWSFQVLRNVIGNWYQRRETRERWISSAPAPEVPGAGTPLEALEESDALSRLERALRLLADNDPACGRYLRRIVEGAEPSDIAREERVDPAAFYRRLYRCRGKLRELLEQEGVSA